MGIEKYLYELLYSHDCVIVPGFGGFIKNYEPASFEQGTQVFLPPRQFVVFNASLVINDGLLATYIAQAENLDFATAMKRIALDVTSWKQRLRAGKQVTLMHIGSFRNNREGNPVFEPDRETNFFIDAYCMTPFIAAYAKKEKVTIAGGKPGETSTLSKLRPYIRAAAITIPLISAGIWATLNHETLIGYSKQSAALFRYAVSKWSDGGQVATPYTKSATPVPGIATEPEVTLLEEKTINPSDESNSSEIQADLNQINAPWPPASESKGYHIVIGAFSQPGNAEALCEALRNEGYKPLISPNKIGLHRVILTSFTDFNLASECLISCREERFRDAWILKL